jgi:DNA transformation protein
MRIRDLRGLGPKSEALLERIGVRTVDELRSLGAVSAFVALQELDDANPSLNFLYALVGALEDRDWREVAKSDRDRLLFELQGREELEKLFGKSGKS